MKMGDHTAIHISEASVPQVQEEHQTIQMTTAQLIPKEPSLHQLENSSKIHGCMSLGSPRRTLAEKDDMFIYEEAAKEKYLKLCVPLYKAAVRGDWKEGKDILDKDMTMLKASIGKSHGRVLHVAAGANQVEFVNELVQLMEEDDLTLRDRNGNTAFCFAAGVSCVEVAEIMRRKNPILPEIRGGANMTPLYMAAMQGHGDMARYLYPKTKKILDDDDWHFIFFASIKNDLYDVALTLLQDNKSLAFQRDENSETGLHVMARKTAAFGVGIKHKGNFMQTQALELVKLLWRNILYTLDCTEIEETISYPSQLMLTAAAEGNVKFLAQLINQYPEVLWKVDHQYRTIIHYAVIHRHASVFNLVLEIGKRKDIVAAFQDDDGNNLLHLAAKLAPANRLNAIPGAALEMQLELLWFEEVKRNMLPDDIDMRNKKGETPRELFSIEHKELLKKAECWMKDTAKSCMMVSTLISTGVFTAAITIPGGNNDDTGTANLAGQFAFLIFVVSDALALISSAVSTLMFLSILIARYSEDDFFMSLPSKLMVGLVTLFISVTFMMIAFSSALFGAYNNGVKWVSDFMCVLSFIPVPLFAILQYPLWRDIIYSTFHARSLFRPCSQMIDISQNDSAYE